MGSEEKPGKWLGVFLEELGGRKLGHDDKNREP